MAATTVPAYAIGDTATITADGSTVRIVALSNDGAYAVELDNGVVIECAAEDLV